MAELEAKLRALAAKGELTHVSVAAVAGKGPRGVVFSACYAPATQFGQGVATDPDPVKALMAAIAKAPTTPKRRTVVKPGKSYVSEPRERDTEGEALLGLT